MGRKLSPRTSLPFSDKQCQRSTHRGANQEKGKINMKPQNVIHLLMGIVCFALSPQSQAANTPNTPDPGPLPISNTADGEFALAGVTGTYNSAFGIYALLSNGAANFNTGVGADVLLSNTANENTAVGTATLLSNTTGRRTPDAAPSRCSPTRQATTSRPSVTERFLATPPAAATRPSGLVRSKQHHRRPQHRQRYIMRSLNNDNRLSPTRPLETLSARLQPRTRTADALNQHGQHRGVKRSLATPPAATTRPSVIGALISNTWQRQHGHGIIVPVLVSPRPITLLLSVPSVRT